MNIPADELTNIEISKRLRWAVVRDLLPRNPNKPSTTTRPGPAGNGETEMGREVRKVPANWQHPKYSEHEVYAHPYREGRFKPLQTGYAADAKDFLAMANEKGLQEAVEYYGRAPDVNDYMPDWPEAECTHLMMYENTSEGTPLTPAFATPEELARYCADNGVSAFGSSKATYEQWLSVAKGGWAPSAVIENGVMKSGVEALAT